jgi:hypothetical protein
MAKSRTRPRSTLPSRPPPQQPRRPPPPRPVRRGTAPPASTAARIIASDTSLLDVLDNLLNQGVVLNADLVLALANVDLVFVRLSALLCAADRLLPDDRTSRAQ